VLHWEVFAEVQLPGDAQNAIGVHAEQVDPEFT